MPGGCRVWEGRRDTSDMLPGFQSCLPHFAQTEFSVVRQHEEFIWLHDAYVENEEYAGLIVRKGRAGWGREGQVWVLGWAWKTERRFWGWVMAFSAMRDLSALSLLRADPPSPSKARLRGFKGKAAEVG